jgi:hypothetical protein
LSLITKVTTELENHLGAGDADLAEFIVDIGEKADTVCHHHILLLSSYHYYHLFSLS